MTLPTSRAILLGILIATFASHTALSQEQNIAALVERIEPAVVRVDVSGEDLAGIGSGFVVDPSGIIVTNHHVIAGASTATVTFRDNSSVAVLGTLYLDEKRDIAILKIDRTGLPSLPLAPALPRKGDAVVAFGAPKGLSFSASTGIVAAVRKGEELSEYISDLPGTWIQTTTPISSGNSGGPLVNAGGNVIGANTLALVQAQNVNFAISSLDIAEALKAAHSASVTPLSMGAAKATSLNSHADATDATTVVSPDAIEEFIKNGQLLYPTAKVEFTRRLEGARNELRAAKSGKITPLAKQRQRQGKLFLMDRVGNRIVFAFPDADTRRQVVARLEEHLANMENIVAEVNDPEKGLALLLQVVGPPLEKFSVGAIGHVPELRVSQIAGPSEFHAYIGDSRVSVQGVSTAGLASDSDVDVGLVYVSGTETYETVIGSTNTVYVLRRVPPELIQSYVAKLRQSQGDSRANVADGTQPKDKNEAFRVWKDRSGKYQVEASLAARVKDNVVLKRRDGTSVTVPLSSLSEDDVAFLEAQSKR